MPSRDRTPVSLDHIATLRHVHALAEPVARIAAEWFDERRGEQPGPVMLETLAASVRALGGFLSSLDDFSWGELGGASDEIDGDIRGLSVLALALERALQEPDRRVVASAWPAHETCADVAERMAKRMQAWSERWEKTLAPGRSAA